MFNLIQWKTLLNIIEPGMSLVIDGLLHAGIPPEKIIGCLLEGLPPKDALTRLILVELVAMEDERLKVVRRGEAAKKEGNGHDLGKV